ncbi:PTS sugar transporter subunit IIC [Lactobacillus delbrueckii]|uniref:PTS sugar transporter subunit IIC n=1 Tax=Lactobacillus delbrueckii TaxID=1584 RepID=A0AAW5YU62_9LACO|nr:PTS sugar transporter subunit IIC [Lactobacillus delbrueckii]MDA3767219.1 PTS sugar transporter subunit IIC [Lactobacillus delbrueckii]
MTESKETNGLKQGTLNILNGIGLGVIAALVPAAILGQLMKALLGVAPAFAQTVINITTFTQSLLAAMAGFCAAYLFQMNMIQMCSVAAAAMIGSGAVTFKNGLIMVAGTGDVINIGLTITLAILLIKLIGNKLGSYTTILLPIIVLVVGGGIGLLILPYVKTVTTFIGMIVMAFTKLQPLLMGVLIGMSFAAMIVSPISSVGIAVAIGLTGVASGAANLGITGAAYTLGIMSYSVNGMGTTLAHFIGTPKIQMANMLEKPKLFVPVLLSSAFSGLLAAIFNLQGTPNSAGFGFSGLIGPLAAYAKMTPGWGSIILLAVLYVVYPVALGFFMRWLFIDRLSFAQAEDLRLEV